MYNLYYTYCMYVYAHYQISLSTPILSDTPATPTPTHSRPIAHLSTHSCPIKSSKPAHTPIQSYFPTYPCPIIYPHHSLLPNHISSLVPALSNPSHPFTSYSSTIAILNIHKEDRRGRKETTKTISRWRV